ncbi:hypothetical protein DAEQUDRAFT_730635 [Daedalea quercina L-15889]|uniref:MYND-type domain-containing protein n=1 Tax=Daedalea quercina L-15889 TaxID=1314783 RepID=A0A165MUC0_9APHY|nr:hypothetical protein DAEQUDRAFT_730635 [Daedalea quercina L-15889]
MKNPPVSMNDPSALSVVINNPGNLPESSTPIPPAPDARRRHPLSDPHEMYTRGYRRRCQHCAKCEVGVTMRKCSACKMDKYRGKECQKAAWPAHKKICKLSQAGQAVWQDLTIDDAELKRRDALRSFTRNHRVTISEAAMRSVLPFYVPPLSSDPVATSEGREDVLVIYLHTRPNAHRARAEKRFFVVDAQLETLAFVPPDLREEERLNLRYFREQTVSVRGACGSLLVVLFLLDPGSFVKSIFPVGFPLNQRSLSAPSSGWKETLVVMLIEGIVV